MTYDIWTITCDHCGATIDNEESVGALGRAAETAGWINGWLARIRRDICPECTKKGVTP